MKEKIEYSCGHILDVEVPDEPQEKEKFLKSEKKKKCNPCYLAYLDEQNAKLSEGCTLGVMDYSLYEEVYKDCALKKLPAKPEDGKAYVYIPYDRAAIEALITVWGTDRKDKTAYEEAYKRGEKALHKETYIYRQSLNASNMSKEKRFAITKVLDIIDLYQNKMKELGTPVELSAAPIKLGESKKDKALRDLNEKISNAPKSIKPASIEEPVAKSDTKPVKEKDKGEPAKAKTSVPKKEESPLSSVDFIMEELNDGEPVIEKPNIAEPAVSAIDEIDKIIAAETAEPAPKTPEKKKIEIPQINTPKVKSVKKPTPVVNNDDLGEIMKSLNDLTVETEAPEIKSPDKFDADFVTDDGADALAALIADEKPVEVKKPKGLFGGLKKIEDKAEKAEESVKPTFETTGPQIPDFGKAKETPKDEDAADADSLSDADDYDPYSEF